MSERKVLNKYYPPDFDPSKIPRMKLAKNRQYTVRLMAPFNMRCITCGEYIYKGKKFNARKEDVEHETYLGIRIYRFYIKCTRCLQEISFKTDPKNTDYEIEAGATRNFMALKLAEEQARKEEEELREEEANNPMKLLENRTQQSRNEIELLESLEELKDLNRRHQSIDYDTMLQQFDTTETERQRLERQEREDEEYVRSIAFKNRNNNQGTKRIVTEEIIEDIIDDDRDMKKEFNEPEFKKPHIVATSVSSLTSSSSSSSITSNRVSTSKGSGMITLSVGSLSNKNSLKNIVKRKDTSINSNKQENNSEKLEENASKNTPRNSNKQDTNSQKAEENGDSITSETKLNNANSSSSSTGGGLALLTAYSDSDDSDNSN